MGSTLRLQKIRSPSYFTKTTSIKRLQKQRTSIQRSPTHTSYIQFTHTHMLHVYKFFQQSKSRLDREPLPKPGSPARVNSLLMGGFQF
jgi:hypothetical protein